jgi:hypothetical protein
MEVSSQLHDIDALSSRERATSIRLVGACVVPRASLNYSEEKNLRFCQESYLILQSSYP